MSILENINLKLSVDKRQVDKQFNEATRTVTRGLDAMTLGAEAFEAKWADITDNIRSVKRVASGIAISAAIYGVTAAIVDASSAVLTFSDNLETARISMDYFAKDSRQALQYIRELEDFAAYTPFNTKTAVEMAKYLQAMSVPIGSSKAVLTVISDTAAATGATEENMQRIVTALGQVLTKGKLAAEEVRQLANANIPIYDILKEELDLTGQEIKDLGNLSIDAGKAVVAILDGLNKRYEGASAKIAETMGGMVETIKDDALIISSSFFAGAIDNLEGKLRNIRDVLDEWREISLHEGTGGMIEHILNDLDPSGELEQYIMDGIAGFKNLSATIHEFATEDGDILRAFGSTVYASIMSVVIAADYLLRGLNTVKDGADKLLGVINDITGMSLTLTDVAAGLLIFKTVGGTLSFAANTAMWMGKSVLNLGTAMTSIIPGIAGASAVTRGFAAALLSVGSAAALSYGALKLMNSITGISDDSTLVTDENKAMMKAYDDALSAYSEGLNQSYDALADGAFEAFTDIEEQSKKSAKKVQKTWLMSFDEVFQIREDPDDDDDLEDFADVDWGKYFSLPVFRFPERITKNLEEVIYSADDAINAARNSLDGVAALLPALIGGLTLAGTAFKNRTTKMAQLQAEGKTLTDEELSNKELQSKFDEALKSYKHGDDLLQKMVQQYDEISKLTTVDSNLKIIRDTLSSRLDEALEIYKLNPSDNNKAIVDTLQSQLDRVNKLKSFVEIQLEKRGTIASNIEALQKKQVTDLQAIRKKQALLNDTTTISTEGISRADNVLSTQKINQSLSNISSLSEDYKSLIDHRNTLIDQLRSASADESVAIKYKLDDINQSIVAKGTAIDTSIKNTGKDMTTHLAKFGNTSGINVSTLDTAVSERMKNISSDIDKLIRNIADDTLERLPFGAEGVGTQLKDIRKSIAGYASVGAGKGLSLEGLDVLDKRISVLDTWYKEYVRKSNTEEEISRATLASTESGASARYLREIDRLKERYLLADKPRYEQATASVRLLDTQYKKLLEIQTPLRQQVAAINKLPSIINTEYVNRVSSVTREINKYLSNGTFGVNSKQQTLLHTLLTKISADVNNLSDEALTKALSIKLLNDAKEALRDMGNKEAYDTLVASFNNYSKDIAKIIDDEANRVFGDMQKLVADVKGYNQYDEMLGKYLETAKESADTAANIAKINSNVFIPDISTARKLDDIIAELDRLSSNSTGEVSTLYSELARIIEDNTTPETIAKELNNFLGDKAVAKTLSIGNTYDQVSKIINDSELKAMSDILSDRMQELSNAIKLSSKATSAVPQVEYGKIVDKFTDEAQRVVDNFYARYKSSTGLGVDRIAELAAHQERLQELYDMPFEERTKYLGELDNEDSLLKLLTGGDTPFYIADDESIKQLSDVANMLESGITTAEEKISKLYTKYTGLLDDAGKAVDKSVEYVGNYAQAVKKLSLSRSDVLTDLLMPVEDVASDVTRDIPAFERLREIFETQPTSPRMMEKAGAFRAGDFTDVRYKMRSAFESVREVLDDVNDQIIRPALSTTRIGISPIGITQQGITAQNSIASLLNKSLTDEYAQTTKSALQMGIAEAWNTRVRSILEDTMGSIYMGGKGADATGKIGAAFDGFVSLNDELYSLTRRTVVSNKSQLVDAIEHLINQASAEIMVTGADGVSRGIKQISFKAFEEATQVVGEDVLNKVAAQLIAAGKTSGAVLSLFNASAFDKVTGNASMLPAGYSTDYADVKAYARNTTASNILRENVPSSTLAEKMQSVIIVRDEALDKYVEAFSKNSDAILTALEVDAMAKANGVTLNVKPSTALGVEPSTITNRYAKTSEMIDEFYKYRNAFDSSLFTGSVEEFEDYLSALIARSADSKYTQRVLTTLQNLKTELTAFKDAATTGNTAGVSFASANRANVGSRSFRYNFSASDDNAKMLSIMLNDAVNTAERVINESVANTLGSFNNIYNMFARGAVSAAAFEDKIDYMISAAQKLEDAFGISSNKMSTELIMMKKAGRFDTSVNNPFRFLTAEESAGKMVSDLMDSLGVSSVEGVFGKDFVDLNQLSRFNAAYDTYRNLVKATTLEYPRTTVANAPLLDVGRASTEEIDKVLDDITDTTVNQRKLTAEAKKLIDRYGDKLADDVDSSNLFRANEAAAAASDINTGITTRVAVASKDAETIADAVSKPVAAAADDIAKSVGDAVDEISKYASDVAESVAGIERKSIANIANIINDVTGTTKSVANGLDDISDTVKKVLVSNAVSISPELEDLSGIFSKNLPITNIDYGTLGKSIWNESLLKAAVDDIYSIPGRIRQGLQSMLTTSGIVQEVADTAAKTSAKVTTDSTNDLLSKYYDDMADFIDNTYKPYTELFSNISDTGTGYKFYDAVFGDATKLTNTSIDGELKAFRDLMQELVFDGSNATAEAIARGDADLKMIDTLIQEQAKELWGDQYKAMAESAGLLDEATIGKKIANGFAEAMSNKFITGLFSEIIPGVSSFDLADSIRQTFEARSAGIDEYNALAEKWTKEFGATVEPFTQSAGNLVSWGEAIETGFRNLAVEGVATGLGINAVGGAVSGAVGATGAAAAGLSMLAAIPLVLGGIAFQYATGAYDVANVASGTFTSALENHNYMYDQLYNATGDKKAAKDAQLKAQRDIYTTYYDRMNFWSNMQLNPFSFDSFRSKKGKDAIANLNTNKSIVSNNRLEGTDTDALAYAIAELTNSTDTLSKYTVGTERMNKGELFYKNNGKLAATSTLDTAKLEEFLYAAITSGAPQRLKEYDTLTFDSLSNIDDQYKKLMKNVDALTEARIRDMYKLEFEAGEFLAAHGKAEVEALLQAYGVAFGNTVTNIEGIIQLYNGALEYTNSVLSAKADAINSSTFSSLTSGLLVSDAAGTVNRLLDFDSSSIDQTYFKALGTATGVYLQSVTDAMTALTLDVDKVRENMTGFTLSMPSTIEVGTEKLNIKAIAADASAVDILAGMGVQINADGTVTISNVAENVNQSGYERTMEMGIGGISDFENTLLGNIGVSLRKSNKDGTTDVKLNETEMVDAIHGLTYTLNGVDPTSIPASVVGVLKAAGINLTQNETTGAMSATIADTGFITGNKTVADMLKGIDMSRLSADLQDSLESIDALVAYYTNKGDSVISSANGVILETDFAAGDYSKALEEALKEVGGTLQEAVNVEGEDAVYLALNKVSDDWSEAITSWKTSEITPELKTFLKEIGAEVETAGEYTIVNTSGVLEALAGDSSKYITEVLFDNAELWETFPDEMKQVLIDAGLATEDGFIVLQGEVLNGWYNINDMYAKSWQALDNETVNAFLRIQGNTIKGWDDLTEEQKVKLSEMGIATEEKYNENSYALKEAVGRSLGLIREDTILGWDELSSSTLEKLNAMGITTEEQYQAYLTDLNVKTGQGLSTVDMTTAAELLSIGATTASGWLGVKQITDSTLSETEALALGYMRFEDLPETIQQALAQGKEGSAYEALHSGWYALATDADTQLGNLDTVVSEQMDNVLNTASSKVAKLRELLSSPEMQAETYMANLGSLADENLKAAKKGSDKYAKGGSGWIYNEEGEWKNDGKQWQNWDDSITIGKQFVAFDSEGGAYYFYNMYLDGKYYGQIAQSAQTGARKKWRGSDTPLYDENSEIPAFKLGGLITGDGLFRAGEFGLNEAVLPLEQPAAMARVGQALAAAIPAYQLVAPLANAIGIRDGGVASFTQYQRQETATQPIEEIVNAVISAQAHRAPQITSTESSKRPLYVGTLIADKTGLRELNRQMKIVERQDGGK